MSFLAQGQGARWLGGPEERIRWHLHGEWAELGNAFQAGYRGLSVKVGQVGICREGSMRGRRVSVASNA